MAEIDASLALPQGTEEGTGEAPAEGAVVFPSDSVGEVAGPAEAAPLPVVLPPQPFVYRRDGDWDCPKCSNLNFARRYECHKCKTPRPGFEGQAPPPEETRPKRPGDWDCACGADNFAFRTECHRCGALPGQGVPRGGGGRDRSRSRERDVGRNGGRPGDWSCQCGMLNFAFRTECHKCQTPKPQQYPGYGAPAYGSYAGYGYAYPGYAAYPQAGGGAGYYGAAAPRGYPGYPPAQGAPAGGAPAAAPQAGGYGGAYPGYGYAAYGAQQAPQGYGGGAYAGYPGYPPAAGGGGYAGGYPPQGR